MFELIFSFEFAFFSSWSTLFFHKQTLNGLWCRITGTTRCNKAVNYSNGRWYLINQITRRSMCHCAINITKVERLSPLWLKCSKSVAISVRKYSCKKRIMQLLSQHIGLDGSSRITVTLPLFDKEFFEI